MKSLKSLLVALMIVTSVFASRPSQAAVGAIFSPALVTAGLYMVGGWAVSIPVGFAVGKAERCTGDASNCTGTAILFYGFMSLLLGLVVLDGEQAVAYAPLTKAQAKEIGITQQELRSYNAEIDQINALVAHVDGELAQMNKPTEKDAAALWTSVKDAVAPETFSALLKVTKQIYE